MSDKDLSKEIEREREEEEMIKQRERDCKKYKIQRDKKKDDEYKRDRYSKKNV